MKSFYELQSETNRTGLEFILAEFEMATSFIDLAGSSSDDGRRQRLLADAKRAYNTVVRLVPRFGFTQAENDMIDSRLQQIRSRLERQGIALD